MNQINLNEILYFEIKKAPPLQNPFINYSPGCSAALITKMKKICPICYKVLNLDIFYPDSCQHGFCSDCLLAWKKISSTCPVCRKPFLLIK